MMSVFVRLRFKRVILATSFASRLSKVKNKEFMFLMTL